MVCARQGSRMTSRGSLLFSFSWQRTRPAQQAWSNKHVALGLAFLFLLHPTSTEQYIAGGEFKKNHYLPASQPQSCPRFSPHTSNCLLTSPYVGIGQPHLTAMLTIHLSDVRITVLRCTGLDIDESMTDGLDACGSAISLAHARMADRYLGWAKVGEEEVMLDSALFCSISSGRAGPSYSLALPCFYFLSLPSTSARY
jgi:hypothetical protein